MNIIYRPASQITSKPGVIVTSDYQTNTTLKKQEIDNSGTGSLRRHGGEESPSTIVGLSIAGALVLIAAITLVYFRRKRKRRNRCKRTGKEENE